MHSPFTSDQGLSLSEEFQERWTNIGDGHDSRGWCNVSVTAAVKRLQQSSGARSKLLAAESAPFIGTCGDQAHVKLMYVIGAQLFELSGEVKVVMESADTQTTALLRVREDEDDSCLWRLRTQDRDLRNTVKRCLSDDE